jgi:drug/metabolite transporter (DMT)-like permease
MFAIPLWFLLALSSAVCWGMAYTASDKIMKMGVSPTLLLAIVNLAQAFVFFSFYALRKEGRGEGQISTISLQIAGIWLVIAIASFAAGNLFIFRRSRKRMRRSQT